MYSYLIYTCVTGYFLFIISCRRQYLWYRLFVILGSSKFVDITLCIFLLLPLRNCIAQLTTFAFFLLLPMRPSMTSSSLELLKKVEHFLVSLIRVAALMSVFSGHCRCMFFQACCPSPITLPLI